MSKSLQTLAKLAKSEVEKLQKELAELLKQEDLLKSDILRLQNAILSEAQIASTNPELGRNFPAFLQATKKKIELAQNKLSALLQRIAKKRDQLGEAFSEQKKFEIVMQNKLLEKIKEEQRKETIMLDEVGVNIFNRKDI